MIIYSKTIETDSFKKLTGLLNKCKISEDIVNNVLEGNIKVKNKEAYDRIFHDLITDTAEFEYMLDKIKMDLMDGNNLLLEGVHFHIFSSRTRLIITLDDLLPKNHKKDIESFLLKKGFDKDEIE